ncbi:co-chaperone GroES [Candidatus Gracilibacteria bacterium]|nr:MAG: co-chaperone GroES [Candidatus Gracilibacteria bacterium]PIE85308.1 MAG: co-chaperone GroES [Candidatus Gracilibacteria bacterium]
MNIKPLSDRVLLKGLEKENITSSGIILPESANKEKPYIYEVIAVGPGKKDIEMNVKVGDKVLCGQYSGDEVKVEDEEFKIVAIEYILAIVE